MTAGPTSMTFRLVLAGICLLGLCACAGTGKGSADKASGPRKLYVDANLGISVTVGGDWSRRFVSPPPGGDGSYAVRWLLAEGKDHLPDSLIEVALLANPAPADIDSALDLVKKQWPAFEATAIDDSRAHQVELLGHTRRTSLLVRLINLSGKTFQLALITPPERFDSLRPAFEMVSNSLVPVPD